MLVAFAEHVAAALEAAHDVAAAARDRAALTQLLEVSASLVDLESVDSVLAAVAKGIQDALEFERSRCASRPRKAVTSPPAPQGGHPGLPSSNSGSPLGSRRALRPGVRDRRVLARRSHDREQARRQRLAIPLAAQRPWAAGLEPSLADRAADRARRLALGLHLGGRPRGLPASFTRAAPGAPNVREPGNDGDPGRRGLRDAQCPEHRAGGAARHRDALARAARRRQRAHLDHAERVLARRHAARVPRARGSGDRPAEDGGKLGLLERVGPSHVARGEGVAGRVWATNSTIAIDDYGTWDGRVEGFAESNFHATVAVPLPPGARSSASSGWPTPRPAGRSGRRRSRSSSASRNSPRSRWRMHASIRRCSGARSCTAASSTARPI